MHGTLIVNHFLDERKFREQTNLYMEAANRHGINLSVCTNAQSCPESDFVLFLENMTNPAKDEFYIPLVVDRSIKVFNEKVVVLDTDEKWYGVTYREDKESVVNAIKKLF